MVLLTPVAVPASMALVFRLLGRRMGPTAAYNCGFAVYWLGWCMAYPLALLGPRTALRLLRTGRRPAPWEILLLLMPVLGAAGTQLVPDHRLVDRRVGLVMAGTGAVNAVGEELLWRGVFLHELPDNLVLGALWPLVGFSVWHLAPQMVLPSPLGRWRFVVGAAAVGSASAASAWRSGGLRNCLLPHGVTDACGVRAARFRLGARLVALP
jgi:membrane protease YdiL (CAAX protease family)